MISIIVPVYNVQQFVGKCIESIQNQTYSDLQIILINDGSTDESGIICDRYAKEDKRIQVIHQENKGPAEARNRGLMCARGEYIGFVDADDWCVSEMFEEMLYALKNKRVDAVRCNYCIVQKNGILNYLKKPIENILSGREAIVNMFRHTKSCGHGTQVWNTLFRAEVICCVEPVLFDSKLLVGEDSDFLARAFLRCQTVLLLPECYYNYNRNNVCSLTYTSKCDWMINSYNKKIEFLTQNYFSSKDINFVRKQKQLYLLTFEIEKYVSSNGQCDTKVLDEFSIIRDGLLIQPFILGIIKTAVVMKMIQLRMPAKTVETIWRLKI